MSLETTAKTKVCKKCLRDKPLSDFYVHPQMADGHLNKCKECAKQDVKGARAANSDHYKQYDRDRYQTPERKAMQYASVARSIAKFPEKRAARTVVSNALRDGRLVKQPCEKCSDPDVEAHHDDYSKPLVVRWLCKDHHVEADRLLQAA